MSAEPKTILIYADGAITPQRAGAGAVAQDERGHVLALANRTLPSMNCSEAEYAGLILALELGARLLSKHGEKAFEVRMDSEVIVSQMTGRFAVNSPKLKPPHRMACELARQIPHLSYKFLPREQNRLADALAAEAAAGRLWKLNR